MNSQNINRFATLAMACCCLLAIAGCQPQNRSAANGGGLFGFGNRPINPSSAFGTNANNGSGIAFNNPFQSGPATFNSAFNPAARNNAFNSGSMAGASTGAGQEFSRINQQLGAFDADNQLLNTEVATLQQKLELANQYNQTLKQQLADTSDRINRSGNQDRINAQQYASMQERIEQLNQRIADQDRMLAQATNANSQGNLQGNFQNTGFRNNNAPFQNSSFGNGTAGSATLRANNGLMQKLSAIQIPGGNARMDGDIIRIEIPTDRLFTSESFRIQPAQLPMLQNITATIRQSFPRQIIGIEAHWDGTPLGPPVQSDHQLTATQSLAVFDELVRLGLPARQLVTMALGSNRPRHRQQNVGGVSPNRRIELVIYPETYDAN